MANADQVEVVSDLSDEALEARTRVKAFVCSFACHR